MERQEEKDTSQPIQVHVLASFVLVGESPGGVALVGDDSLGSGELPGSGRVPGGAYCQGVLPEAGKSPGSDRSLGSYDSPVEWSW